MLLDPHYLATLLRETARLSVWLLLLSLLFLPLEHLFAVRPRKVLRQSLFQDVSYYFLNGLVPALLLATPLTIVALAVRHFMPWTIQQAIAAIPLWQRVLAGFVVSEIGFYWGHRLTHQIPFLWRFHAVHHSAEEIYFLISARGHPFDNVFTRLCGMVPAVTLGVASPLSPDGTWVPALIIVAATTWGFFIHANFRLRLGPLEWIIATPAFHHWHHTRDDHKDRNFASMLPVMDIVFGTFYLPGKFPEQYGTSAVVAPGLAGQLLDPLLPGILAPEEQRPAA